MKNKDRIAQLEKEVQVLLNRVTMLEVRLDLTPAAPPVEWPLYKPFWIDGPPVGPCTIMCNSQQVH